MDINRLRKLSGLNESVEVKENVGNEGLLRAALECLQACQAGDTSGCDEMISAIKFEIDGDDYGDDYDDEDGRSVNDYFDDLDAGDTEMDRRSDLRRGW